MAQTRFINPEGLNKPPGYTHVVEAVGPGRIVYIAGQLGIDSEERLADDFRQQAVRAYENLKLALAAVGARFEDVVKFNNYLVDRQYMPIFREVRDRYLPVQNRPASTTLAISGLAREGALLEIEAVAMLPAKRAATGRRRTASSKRKTAARKVKVKARRKAR
jgi:enamine deaminase RidA (YjgF/YER057c/UK114 family)